MLVDEGNIRMYNACRSNVQVAFGRLQAPAIPVEVVNSITSFARRRP